VKYNVTVELATGQDGRNVRTVGVREVASSCKNLIKKSDGEKPFEKTTAQMGE
jgi:hypothetical protein